jgi:molybdate transport system substrate-binding protein
MKKRTIIGFLVILSMGLASCAKPPEEIYWYCAASMKKPAEKVVRMYNQKGGRVLLIAGGSGQVLNKMISSGRGDIYTPASNHFGAVAREKGIVAREWPLLEQKPVFALAEKGHIQSFNDLWKGKWKLGTGNAKSMALGKTWVTIMETMPGDMQKGFNRNIRVTPVNISQTVNYIKTETIDAGLVFDSVARVNDLPYIEIPEQYNRVEKASLMLVNLSSNKNEAEKFIRFVLEQGEVYNKYGFTFTGKK